MTDIKELEQYVMGIDSRVRVLEGVITDEHANLTREDIQDLRRIVVGDSNLGIVPIMEQIKALLDFHDSMKEFLSGVKAAIVGLVIFDIIMLISIVLIVASLS